MSLVNLGLPMMIGVGLSAQVEASCRTFPRQLFQPIAIENDSSPVVEYAYSTAGGVVRFPLEDNVFY